MADDDRRDDLDLDPGLEEDWPEGEDFSIPPDEPGAFDDMADAAEDWAEAQLLDGGLDEPPPSFGIVEPSYSQPVGKHTMVCLRGPCIHYWHAVSRYKVVGKELRLQASHSCLYGPHEAPLSNSNVYVCSGWWPAFLAWVPESLRSLLRPKLNKLYRLYLEKIGYDFKWKSWDDDVFFSDRPELRTDGSIGGRRVRTLGVPLHGPGED